MNAPVLNREQRRKALKAAKRTKHIPAKFVERHLDAAGDAIARIHDRMGQMAQEAELRERLKRQMADDQQTAIGIAHRMALDSLTKGVGTEAEWNTVVCSLNIALVLCERGFGADYEPLIKEALDGIFRSKLRAGRSGKWGLDGPAMSAIKEAFEVHEAQLAHPEMTQAEVMSALGAVYQRIDEGYVYREDTSPIKEAA